MLREAMAACREAASTGAPLDEIAAIRAARMAMPGRRQVLGGAAGLAATALLPRRSFAIGQPRVAIIGGGMAGLVCAASLWKNKQIAANIFEWNGRVGGRVETLRGYFANGQTAEQHAEFISSEHTGTLELAQAFGLTLENTNAFPRHDKDTYWTGDARYTQADLNADWQSFGWKLFRDAVKKAPHANYRSYSPDAYIWDHMSVPEWIEMYVPGGVNSHFGKLCCSDVISEFGGPPENQSALNLLYLLGFDDSEADDQQPPDHPVLAGTNEKWHIHGGNDQLVSGLAERLPEGTIHLHHRLIALRENADASYTCTFARDHRTVEYVADHVVLTIPFTTLRQVDLSKVHLSPLKRLAIETLPLGNNAKIQIQVAGRPWRREGYTGDMLSSRAPDGGWDGSSYQNLGDPLPTEIWVAFPGGTEGKHLARKYDMKFGAFEGPAPDAMVRDTLAEVEPIFPGIGAAWQAGPRLAWVNDGNIDPHLLGAWSQYNVGQYTGFSGVERERQGNIHFAGEHTSLGFQGFIEGAVRSGVRAAEEI
jgi:monoamine oxidase